MASCEFGPATGRAADEFITALGDPDRRSIPAQAVAVIVAHPDDETIGCGAQLKRLDGVTVVVTTDGAPRNLFSPNRAGSDAAHKYAAKRAKELVRALALAKIPQQNIISLGFSDQTAALRLPDLTRAIRSLILGKPIRVVLTHTYEGGHPDHDATCFAVHAAGLHRHPHPIAIIEMPLYKDGNGNWLLQQFEPDRDSPELLIRLTDDEQNTKQSMVEAYASQRDTLLQFPFDSERFRVAPKFDFTVLPNGGRLLYERYDWGMTGQRWLELVRSAARELDLPRWH